jgi:hypothetical protein
LMERTQELQSMVLLSLPTVCCHLVNYRMNLKGHHQGRYSGAVASVLLVPLNGVITIPNLKVLAKHVLGIIVGIAGG